MLTEEEILYTLDNYRNSHDPIFVQLGHPYVYPIDSRINVFSNSQGSWALAVEVLGYDPRSEPIGLEITYYGNCLINLDYCETYFSNSYCVLPIDEESFRNTIEYEELKPGAQYWNVRNKNIELTHNIEEYLNAGISLKEFTPGAISAEEVARLLVTKHRDLFRATDEELYKSIPTDLKKILVIDEWHHRDFYQNDINPIDGLPFTFPGPGEISRAIEDQIEKMNEFNITKETLLNSFDLTEHNEKRLEQNKNELENNRPGSYETWQLIAKVIVTGNPSEYKPTLEPTSHWKNWPDAGSL